MSNNMGGNGGESTFDQTHGIHIGGRATKSEASFFISTTSKVFQSALTFT